ncbi:MAG: cellulose synthase/poly-beta-1,6-N-acetylglucosamine synthase-like glycosyltransferase [Marinoscillum sp.]|jgi:cellulose synthase/poly-beta-1,6-N-acetylglucosamine synthase-like glycosyltransferase
MNIPVLPILSLLSMTTVVLACIFGVLMVLHSFLFLRNAIPLLRFRIRTNHKSSFPHFTVIVAAHNELENLQKLLPNLLSQDYPSFDIIIALDRTTDGSREYLIKLKSENLKILDINTVPDSFHGKKYALTQAIAQAQNDWLLFTDADCMPISNQWIQSFGSLTDETNDLIIGLSPYQSKPTFLSRLISYETFQTAVSYFGAAMRGKPYMGVGRNMAYRKSAFMKVNGFGQFQGILGGDDDLLVQQLVAQQNFALNGSKESLTFSEPKKTWSDYLHQKTRHFSVGKYYLPRIKAALAFEALIHSTLWLTFLYLLTTASHSVNYLSVFTVLIVLKGVIFHQIAVKFRMPLKIVWLPIVDLIFAVFLPLIGLKASVEQNIRWK